MTGPDNMRPLLAAEQTLLNLGYTYQGGQLWKPPLGKAPDFDRNDSNAALLREIDTHMRAMWGCRKLPAECWPTHLARRVSEAAGTHHVPHDETMDQLLRTHGL